MNLPLYHRHKAGRLLAHQLRRQAASNIISQIKDPTGILDTDPAAINSTFSSFYSTLYTSGAAADSTEMHSFLDGLNFPAATPVDIERLDSPLNVSEIVTAISEMQSNKAPGPDGFPVEFFKKFKDKLAPLLHSVYIESLESGSLPPTLRQASINVLLKKDKDPDLCTSYRPISLINVDTGANCMSHYRCVGLNGT